MLAPTANGILAVLSGLVENEKINKKDVVVDLVENYLQLITHESHPVRRLICRFVEFL